MKRVFITAMATTALLWLCPNLKAQSYGGAILDHDLMMPSDIASLSQSQIFGTARAMGMGGAFTSLGADLSSVSINPAGLGMYMHDEFSISPMLTLSSFPTANQNEWQSENKTSFALSNFGFALNMIENSNSPLISLTGAFTYNRTSDYNSRLSFSNMNPFDNNVGYTPSMIDVFGQQLGSARIFPDSEGRMSFDNNPYFWPAQLAYKGYMLDVNAAGDGWTTNTLGYNASVLGSLDVLQRGRASEYAFALGGNISNVLYFGASITINEITQATEYAYQEEYLYDNGFAYADVAAAQADVPMNYQLAYAHLSQKTTLNGAGVGLKLGLVARPTRSLRIGVAFHTPTIYDLSRSYEATIETSVLGNYDDLLPQETFVAETDIFLDEFENSWSFSTPAVLQTGISYQLGPIAILSVDYERKWYNSIRVQNTPLGAEYSEQTYKETYKSNYVPTDALRAGVEVRPIRAFALRAGAGYTSSMLGDESLFYSSPVATNSYYFSLGAGIRFTESSSLDLAYQNHIQNYSQYRFFYSEDSAGFITASEKFKSTLNRHYIVATFTSRF